MPEFDDDARLGNKFTEFRDEVAPYVSPPGSAAARRRVRRRRRVGAAAIAACAVLFVGGPTVGFVAASDDTPTPLPVGPVEPLTPSPTTPTPTSPAPKPTATSAPPHTPPMPPVTGDVFYTDFDGKIYVNGRQYRGGDHANVSVSPDGKRLLWVEQGVLMLSDLDGKNRHSTLKDVDWLCREPVWSGDSSRVLLTRDLPQGSELVVMYLAGGAGDYLGAAEGCHYRWSADGERVGVFDGEGKSVAVWDLVGGGHRVTLDRSVIDGRYYADLHGISADGGRVCVVTVGKDGRIGDAGRAFGCDTVIDVATKKTVDLPIDGELRSVVFLADGGMLARVKTDKGQSELLRLDADDRVAARSVESAANAERLLLSYTP